MGYGCWSTWRSVGSPTPRSRIPTTAVQAIDRLHDCLRQLAGRPLPDGMHRDEQGTVRLMTQAMTWDGYVHLARLEIRRRATTRRLSQ